MKAIAFHQVEKQEAWRVHLQDVVASVGIPSNTLTEHVAASVALYCRRFHPNGVAQNDLNLLLARALCTVGKRDFAEQVLQTMQPHRMHVERWLEILSELHQFPELLPCFSQGVIRPADWAGARLDRMWTLDLARLALDESEQHEIMLYRSVRTIIEHMIVFWDATSGAGVLGLKGIARMEMGKTMRKGGREPDGMDLFSYVSDLIAKQGGSRGWTELPVLLNLDL